MLLEFPKHQVPELTILLMSFKVLFGLYLHSSCMIMSLQSKRFQESMINFCEYPP